jgi:GntR family transcriptional regulator
MPSTPRRRRSEISEVMRRRVLGGVAAGTLRRNDRLPSARELAVEFDVDPRLVLSAYRVLSREGLVDIRRRSGIYVAGTPPITGGPSVIADGWIIDVLFAGIERGLPAPKLGDWLRRCVTTRRLRAAVVALASDQLEGLCGDLRELFGVDAVPFAPAVLDGANVPTELAAADFVVTEETYVDALRARLTPLGKRVILAGIRPDLDTHWHLLRMAQPVHVVLTDPRTEPLIMKAAGEHASRVRTLILGRDDLQGIPADAPVYVTRSARQRLGGVTVPGQHIPAARSFDTAASMEILKLIVGANLKAMRNS